MSAALVLLVAAPRAAEVAAARSNAGARGLVVPYGVLLLAWFTFFYVIWGSPLPQAPYGAMMQTTPWNLVFGVPGLLFDQEYGLLPTRRPTCWRSPGSPRCGALAASGGCWRSRRRWCSARSSPRSARSGSGGAARRRRRGRWPRRCWCWRCPSPPPSPRARRLGAAGGAAPAAVDRRRHGADADLRAGRPVVSNGRDGTSALLEWWSPRWELWTLAPSFIVHEAPTALLHAAAWLAIAARGRLLSRTRAAPGPAPRRSAACGVFGAALLAAASSFRSS